MKAIDITDMNHHRKQPTDKFECLEAVWSQGRACKRCFVSDCYRQGWEKRRVDADNARLVREKHKADRT